jgi:hypothetical protein
MKDLVIVNTQFSKKICMISLGNVSNTSNLSSQHHESIFTQNTDENKSLCQSLFFIVKRFFYRYEMKFSPFQALDLFRKCAEIEFENSFVFYCECIDFCIDYPFSDEDFDLLLKHFSSSNQYSELNFHFAIYFYEHSKADDLNQN